MIWVEGIPNEDKRLPYLDLPKELRVQARRKMTAVLKDPQIYENFKNHISFQLKIQGFCSKASKRTNKAVFNPHMILMTDPDYCPSYSPKTRAAFYSLLMNYGESLLNKLAKEIANKNDYFFDPQFERDFLNTFKASNDAMRSWSKRMKND